jgi:hypothetical protein
MEGIYSVRCRSGDLICNLARIVAIRKIAHDGMGVTNAQGSQNMDAHTWSFCLRQTLYVWVSASTVNPVCNDPPLCP